MSDLMRNIFGDIVPVSLSGEFTDFRMWVKARLGESDNQSVELTDEQIWFALSESDMEFSAAVAKAQAKNMMSHFYGQSKDTDIMNSNINFSFSYLNQISLSYGDQIGVGGRSREWVGKVALSTTTQRYYLPETMTDLLGEQIDWNKDVRILEVMQNDYVTQMRYVDTWSYYNIMAGEFGVQSALYNTMFAMMPVNANVMMMQHTKFNNKLRLSMYSWELVGKTLVVFPKPSSNSTMFIRYSYQAPSDLNESITSADGDVGTGTKNGVGNFTQLKTNPLEWSNMNAIAKRWIRAYGLAISKEILAFNRGKFQTIPFASENNTVQLNYEMLNTQAREEKNALKEELQKDLDMLLNYSEQLKRDAEAAESVNKMLSYEPTFIYWR